MSEIDSNSEQFMEWTYNIPEVNLESLNKYYDFGKYISQGIKTKGFTIKRIIPYQDIINGIPVPHDDCNIQKRLTTLYYDKAYEELSDEEKARIDYILEDMTVIAFSYVENEWQNYYRYLYNKDHISKDESDTSKTHHLEIQKGFLKDMLTLFEVINNPTKSHSLIRVIDDYKSVISNKTIKIEGEEQLSLAEHILKIKFDAWIKRYKPLELIDSYNDSIGKTYRYGIDEVPMEKYSDELATITNQAIFYLYVTQTITPNLSHDYISTLYKHIDNNFPSFKATSVLNHFNKILTTSVNDYLENDLNSDSTKFKVKNKDMFLFSLLVLFNLIPKDNINIQLSGKQSSKEDYVKELLRAKPDKYFVGTSK